MGIRQSLLMIQMTAAMLGGDPLSTIDGNEGPTRDDIERQRMQADQKYRENLAKKGAKEYHIDGHTVTARSYEKALKKAKKLSHG